MGKLGYKFTEEQRKRVSLGLLGKTKTKEHNMKVGLANKGKKRTLEQCKNISEAHKGHKTSQETRLKMSLSHKGKVFSDEHKRNISNTKLGKKNPNLSGEKHHQWKGGITPLTKLIRHTFENRQWISDVFHRDDFTCQKCFIRGGNINAHHIKQFSVIFKEYNIQTLDEAIKCRELWNLNNGITLCKKCHTLIHKKDASN